MTTPVTVPTLTPRKVTGEPTSSPAREPWKNRTPFSLRLKYCPPPKARTPAISSAMAPTTKPPMSLGLDLLAILGSPCFAPRPVGDACELPAQQEVAHNGFGQLLPTLAPGRAR